jgi:hypothetical protein
MAESEMAADLAVVGAWSTVTNDWLALTSGAVPLLTGSAASAAAPSAPAAAPTSPAVAPSSSTGLQAEGQAAAPTITVHPPALGRFTTLATPFNATAGGIMAAGNGGVYFATGSNLWFLNETTGKWSGPWALPASPVLGITPMPNGKVAVGLGVGNIDRSNGTIPGQFAVVDTTTGKVTLSNLQAGMEIRGSVVAGDGSVLAATAWSGWLTGQTSNHLQDAVWASSDGVHFSLRSQVPDTGALFFIDKASDGSNRLWAGGEGPNGPWQSTDNGKTWKPLGTFNSKGFSGNVLGTWELPDGTLLVDKRWQSPTGQYYPLVRGLPGGTWSPSSSGLPGWLTVFNVVVTPTGAVIAGVGNSAESTNPVGGAYVSYDNGNTWTSLQPNGVPALPTSAMAATSNHVYVWPKGTPIFVTNPTTPPGGG